MNDTTRQHVKPVGCPTGFHSVLDALPEYYDNVPDVWLRMRHNFDGDERETIEFHLSDHSCFLSIAQFLERLADSHAQTAADDSDRDYARRMYQTVAKLREAVQVHTLPLTCAARLLSDNSPILIKRGESGYTPLSRDFDVDSYNARRHVTDAQINAMLAGSMFNWSVPGADPLHPANGRALPKTDPLDEITNP